MIYANVFNVISCWVFKSVFLAINFYFFGISIFLIKNRLGYFSFYFLFMIRGMVTRHSIII